MPILFTAIDLFAGIGGFRLAIERNGGHCTHFSEINNDAINSYIANFPDSLSTNLGDITKLTELPKHDLLTGGVPCQSWSIAGRNLGFDDDRGQLWNDALFLLNQSRPKAFIFENVKGLSDPRNEEALKYILNRIKEAEYYANVHVLNSYDYGVPQSRVRIYIVGFREKHFFDKFRLPCSCNNKTRLADILDDYEGGGVAKEIFADVDLFGQPIENTKTSTTSLSRNNNGFNDYFLFNDIRNGGTTIHSWDIINTTKRQKHICLLLLRNRRKKIYGCLDGNPLSLSHFQALDNSITPQDIDELVKLGIFKAECYAYRIVSSGNVQLDDVEKLVLSKSKNDILIFDKISKERCFKVQKINLTKIFDSLLNKGVISCVEMRYDFKYTKISTGLFGVNRIFLPCSNIFPTLVASDSNDFVTTVNVLAENERQYKEHFISVVYNANKYRKITQAEACRIQGFPADFILPQARTRWMKLIGNSVSVPVIEKLVKSICDTGVFKA